MPRPAGRATRRCPDRRHGSNAVLRQKSSSYWPGVDDPFGAFINPVRTHVISSTLRGELGWSSSVIDGDPDEYIRTLQQDGAGDISVVWATQPVVNALGTQRTGYSTH